MAYRWLSSALHGRWCSDFEEALFDALRAGQAIQGSDHGAPVILKPFASIEAREFRPVA